jgi:hypothetical protein
MPRGRMTVRTADPMMSTTTAAPTVNTASLTATSTGPSTARAA